MDDLSFLLFFIYTMIILIIMIYISPVLSAVVMIAVPVALVYFLPDLSAQFFSLEQVSYMGVPVHNIHILLIIWAALIGIVVYSELLSWYLLMDQISTSERQEKAAAALIKGQEPPKSTKDKIEGFLLRLGKIMSGGK